MNDSIATEPEHDPQGTLRADARRSADALIVAARELFATRGVEVTTREIAAAAGVGMGTLYRRFPRRADLVGAVFQRELDALADASASLADAAPPIEALERWMQLYAALLVTKRGLARAVASNDPVYVGIAAQFEGRLLPIAASLHERAVAAGDVPPRPDAAEIMAAVSALSMASPADRPDGAEPMVAIFLAGLRRVRDPRCPPDQRADMSFSITTSSSPGCLGMPTEGSS